MEVDDTYKKIKVKRITNYPFGKGPRPVEYWEQGPVKGITGVKKYRVKKIKTNEQSSN